MPRLRESGPGSTGPKVRTDREGKPQVGEDSREGRPALPPSGPGGRESLGAGSTEEGARHGDEAGSGPGGTEFALKKAGGESFKVSPLEGLWTAEDMTAFLTGDKEAWDWTMMIRQPGTVTAELVARLVDDVATRKGLPSVRALRLERFREGLAAQVLHVGPYASEGPTIAHLHDFIHAQGCDVGGLDQRHHEIYLSDPRRAAPERLRTIVRQPFRSPDHVVPS